MTDRNMERNREREHKELERRDLIMGFSNVVENMSHSMVQIYSRYMAVEGITLLQYHALKAVSTSGPRVDMTSISSATGLPASSITGIIDRLDARGLVKRQHDLTDRRRVLATVTEDGVALIGRIQEQELELLEQLLSASSTEEIGACLSVFYQIDERIQKLVDDRPAPEADGTYPKSEVASSCRC